MKDQLTIRVQISRLNLDLMPLMHFFPLELSSRKYDAENLKGKS